MQNKRLFIEFQEASHALHPCRELRRANVQETRPGSVQRAPNSTNQGRQQQEARRMGRSLQNRQCWQSPQSRWLLLRCNQGINYTFIITSYLFFIM